MSRLRQWFALAGLSLLSGVVSALPGQSPAPVEKKVEEKPADQWLFDRTLAISPAAAPVPNFRYRLYPSAVERKPGNAVPIYLRFAHGRSDARKKELREKSEEWNKLPLEKLPLVEVKAFLEEHILKYNLKQLDVGARRATAEWSHTLDVGDPIGLLLPDVQEMRIHAPLLVLKARVEIAEGHHADAVRTLETGFSFSQQVGQGLFLIQSLVGVACANLFADTTLEFVERPGAPNLYWALTVLPRPLVDLRNANEFEQSMLELQFPEMADLDRSRTPEQWDAALSNFRRELERVTKLDPDTVKPRPGTMSSDPAGKSPDLPVARKYLTEVVGMTAAHVEAMPPAQILMLYISHLYHAARDETYRGSYLPFPQGLVVNRESVERLKTLPDTEAARLARLLLPAVQKVQLAQARLERKLAALRAIEALRLHAAQKGELPEKLDQVTEAPVPDDPGTGRPFGYERDGQTATLTSRIPGEPLNMTGLRYRITLRK
jgi:hypothetical protein